MSSLKISTFIYLLMQCVNRDYLFCSRGLGYHRDLTTRAIFMEVLMKILNQGTEFDTLAETATRDRYEQLANLMATMSEKGELLLAVALANVVPSSEQDDLAQVMVTLFDAMNLLYQFLWNVLSQEVKSWIGRIL